MNRLVVKDKIWCFNFHLVFKPSNWSHTSYEEKHYRTNKSSI